VPHICPVLADVGPFLLRLLNLNRSFDLLVGLHHILRSLYIIRCCRFRLDEDLWFLEITRPASLEKTVIRRNPLERDPPSLSVSIA
jgi:hypothetical protein